MTEKEIKNYVTGLDLNVKNLPDARFMDQKCIPDVVSAVSECILMYIGDDDNKEFTKNDIWYSDYAQDLITTSFSKPDLSEASAEKEYDKFFGQPLRLLAYAGVLNRTKKKNKNIYTVARRDILNFISIRERNALSFLYAYLEKLINDNNLMEYFEDFFIKQDNNSLNNLRDKLFKFYNDNTRVKKQKEPPRIFNKIINIFAYCRKKKGADMGRLSDGIITLYDIRYNKPNWRDQKEKTMTRQAFKELVAQEAEDKTSYMHYSIEKAKRFVRTVEADCSEVHRFSPKYSPTQAHHIFMASDFPELADCPENIICLTPNQHYNLAHPNNKTSIIDLDYQIVCLLCKLDSIEINFRNGKDDYSLSEFVNVLNTGLCTNFFNTQMDYEEVKYGIIKKAYYHK